MRHLVQVKNEIVSPVYNAFIRGRQVALQRSLEAQPDLPGIPAAAHGDKDIMSPRDKARAQHLVQAITRYSDKGGFAPGPGGVGRLDILVAQFIDSLRRVEFAHHVRDARHDPGA